jgi:hypothetical protein
MRKQIVRIALALALGAISTGIAAAKLKSRMLTFGSDFWVGETLVKKGTYKVAYDDKSGEVSISDKETTLAKTTVRTEKRDHSKAGWDVTLAPKGDQMTLVSLSFPGDRQTLVLGDTSGSNSQNSSAASPK